MKKFSVGIDFSKKTFDATIVMRTEYNFTELAYCKFDNEEKGFRAFEKWVKANLKPYPEAKDKSEWLFCGEQTGTCSTGLCDYLAKKGYFMWLETAYVIHQRCGIVREKNDRIDSRRIGEYALRNFDVNVKRYELDSQDLKKLKSLFAAHNMLTRDKVAKNNQLKSGTLDFSPLAKREVAHQLDAIEKSLKSIDREIEKLLSESEEFAHNYSILNSFKGVGTLTIACLIIKTRNFTNMTDPRELGCFAGVVPHKVQSGTSIDKKGRTSRFRDREMNTLLTSCATSAINHNNPIIRPYYDRLLARGVHHNKAKNNCKYKILNVLLAMIRNNTVFSMEIHGKSKKEWSQAV